MAEVDPVILKLIADNRAYRAELTNTTRIAKAALGQQQNAVKNLERQFKSSSSSIALTVKGLAGALAAAFSVQRIKELADGYTRFTNQLAVAGLEGTRLARTQETLFAIAQRYGVELESLGTLYSRGTQSSKELGASQADLIQFSSGVAAALKIQGTSATEARGALLQLSQILASGTVRAEEFNSVNEGALPILTAVANNIAAAGGSVGKLKLLVNDGKVSSQEFFRAFLAGSKALEEQAAKSSLTIGNAFTVLNNALGLYIGRADDSLSATERISAAIIALSENLDTVATAIAVISSLLLGRFVAGAVAGSGALRVLAAYASIATTSLAGTALAARGAGAALLTAFGGPVGIAVTALTLGLYYLATRTEEADKATGEYAEQSEHLKKIQERVIDATDRLATATGKARVEALANARAVREETIQYLANARAALIAARAKAQEAATASRAALSNTTSRVGRGFESGLGQSQAQFDAERRARANVRVAEANLLAAKIDQKTLDREIAAPPPVNSGGGGGGKGKPKKGGKGTDPEDVERRFVDDLDRSNLELAQAQADIIGTLEARRDFELERIEADRLAQVRSINANKDYNKAQKQQLLDLNDEIAAARVAGVAAETKAQLADDALLLAVEDVRNEQEILEASGRLAETAKERKEIELRLLDLQYKEERLRLEAIRDNQRANDAEREAARRRLATLDKTYGLARQDAERRNESPLAAYYRRTNKNRDQITEQVEGIVVSELEAVHDGITDALAKAIGVEDPLIKQLLHLFIEQVIMKPIADALRNANSNGFGGNGSLSGILSSVAALFGGSSGVASNSGSNFASGITSAFGRASGGYVGGGQLVRVNEGAGGKRVEGWRPQGAGHVIPLGQMKAAQSAVQRSVVEVRVEGSRYFEPTVRQISGNAAVQVFKAGAPSLVRESVKQANRSAPTALARFQSDGT